MKKIILIAILLVPGIFFCYSKDTKTQKKVIYTKNAPKPIGPYSQAILAGNTLYISGQIAIDTVTSQIINAVIKKETEVVLNNIKAVLKEAGFEMQDIVKTTIFLTDLSNFSIVNTVYAGYFSGNYPARETVQVSQLPKGAHVEISVIAVK
jgi:2-iminobutanoate/2-iminopropanoate deaminase